MAPRLYPSSLRSLLFGGLVLVGAAFAASTAADTSSGAQQDPAATVDATAQYLFYLHGRAVELGGADAVSDRYGRYEYDAIVRGFSERGFTVISEVRPASTTLAYADGVAAQIKTLIAAGVPPRSITVVGHSKGGALTIATAGKLAERGVGFVILAGCGASDNYDRNVEQNAAHIRGRLLSLYDTADDEAGTCHGLFEAADGTEEEREIAFRTGLGHGLFFSATADWMDVVDRWATADDETDGTSDAAANGAHVRDPRHP
jgi:pimeloyl-ACP methyl ester carboxylesterase